MHNFPLMIDPAYPPARAAAAKLEAQFAQNQAFGEKCGVEGAAPQPWADAIETIINAAFWASLRRDEGRDPQISLALLPPDRAGKPMVFEEPIPLAAEALAGVAPAVVRPGIHLGVWPQDGELSVWGTTRTLPCLCFVLEVLQPGLLVVKYPRGEGIAKFGNVAVLKGDEVKFVDERLARLPDYPEILASLVGFDPAMPLRRSPAVLVQLAVSMRAHGHGGTLLVVPEGTSAWKDSLVWPVRYLIGQSRSDISDLLANGSEDDESVAFHDAMREAVDAVAGLTAVDGATVISSAFDVLAFGVKIGRPKQSAPIPQVTVTEPIEGHAPKIIHPTQLGGTRHLSAAQFVYDQRDALALVASQDGRFTLFAWSPSQGMVRAHQIASLLV